MVALFGRYQLPKGYALNRQRLEANTRELEAALLLVRKAVQSPNLLIEAGRGLIELITRQKILKPEPCP